MAHAFLSTDQLTAPWALAVRLFAALAGPAGAALTRTLQCRRHFSGGRIWLPPVSSEWLLEHEARSSKHRNDV